MTNTRTPFGTTEDLFLGGALRIVQPARGYRAGLDAVLLAAACPAVADQSAHCLDCGSGVGTVGLAVARRIAGLQVTAIEQAPELATLAQVNATANGLGDRVQIVTGDLTGPLSALDHLAARVGTFDHVLANPPYYAHAAGTRSGDRLKDGSHAMASGVLEAWVRFAAAMAKPGGSYTLIHRADALPEALAALKRRFGRLLVLALHARAGQPATRVIIQGIKGSRAPLQILPGGILHAENVHAFTPAFDAVLRHGAALPLVPL